MGNQVHAFLKSENIALSKTSAQSRIRNSLQGRITEFYMSGSSCSDEVYCGVLLNALIIRQSVNSVFFPEFRSSIVLGKFCPYAPVKGENL